MSIAILLSPLISRAHCVQLCACLVLLRCHLNDLVHVSKSKLATTHSHATATLPLPCAALSLSPPFSSSFCFTSSHALLLSPPPFPTFFLLVCARATPLYQWTTAAVVFSRLPTPCLAQSCLMDRLKFQLSSLYQPNHSLLFKASRYPTPAEIAR